MADHLTIWEQFVVNSITVSTLQDLLSSRERTTAKLNPGSIAITSIPYERMSLACSILSGLGDNYVLSQTEGQTTMRF